MEAKENDYKRSVEEAQTAEGEAKKALEKPASPIKAKPECLSLTELVGANTPVTDPPKRLGHSLLCDALGKTWKIAALTTTCMLSLLS